MYVWKKTGGDGWSLTFGSNRSIARETQRWHGPILLEVLFVFSLMAFFAGMKKIPVSEVVNGGEEGRLGQVGPRLNLVCCLLLAAWCCSAAVAAGYSLAWPGVRLVLV